MKRAAVAVVLLGALVAQAADPVDLPTDKPVMLKVLSGVAEAEDEAGTKSVVNLQPGAFINDKGMTRLTEAFKDSQVRALEAEAQNRRLRAAVDDVEKSPPVNWPVVLGVAGGGLLIGLGVGIAAGFALKK